MGKKDSRRRRNLERERLCLCVRREPKSTLDLKAEYVSLERV